MATPVPPPPEGRFGKWAYQLWDYVAKNRPGFSNARISGTAPIAVSSSGTSSFGISHNTSGVSAGTYGTNSTWPLLVIDARGHVTSASAGGTVGAAGLVAVGDVLGTTTTGTLTAALSTTGVAAGTYGGTAGIPRFDIDAKGRVLSGTTVVLTADTPILLSAGSGTLAWSHADAGTGITPGATYGAGGLSQQFILDTKGHVTFAGAVNKTPYYLQGAHGTNTMTASYAQALGPTSFGAGDVFWFDCPANNNAAMALTVVGSRGTLGPAAILFQNQVALSNDFIITRKYMVVYDGTQFQIIGPQNRAIDNQFAFSDSADTTKRAYFNASAIPTGSSLTFDFPGVAGTLALATGTSYVPSLMTGNNSAVGVAAFSLVVPVGHSAVDLIIKGLSISGGTSTAFFRVGTGPNLSSGGYNSVVSALGTAAVVSSDGGTTGFPVTQSLVGASVLSGILTVKQLGTGSSVVGADMKVSVDNSKGLSLVAGAMSLPARMGVVGVELTGTATFDAGTYGWRSY